MVSTRLMSSVNNNTAGESSAQGGGGGVGGGGGAGAVHVQEQGPAKFTRHSTVIAAAPGQASTSQQQPPPLPQLQHQQQQQPPSLLQPAPREVTFTRWTADQTVFFMDLPFEVIEKILSFLSFKNVAHLRPVSQSFDQICGLILNSTFQHLQTQMLHRFHGIKSKMPRRESARRNHPLACESDIVETLHMRLTLLQMTFGKHIERRHCCFFPGEILDEVYRILHYIRVTPKLSRPYKVTDELFDLSTMAMEYFKEHIEPKLPEIAYFSSDFLDFTTTFSSAGSSKNYLCLESPPQEAAKEDSPSQEDAHLEELVGEPLPQSNMVLRKRIRKIKQGMKRYNSQLSLLRQDLRGCKRKAADQQRQISEQQKQLAEQQKQALEYASRLDENDKKNEEVSRKFSTLLQELNKCKTELQYWRSKSPAVPPVCSGCGSVLAPLLPHDELPPPPVDAPPSLDFVPIAGSAEDAADAEVQRQMCKEPAAGAPPDTCAKGKRKAPDDELALPPPPQLLPQPQPSAAAHQLPASPDPKKTKRIQKGRSKRLKV